jgi:hypothetical protein
MLDKPTIERLETIAQQSARQNGIDLRLAFTVLTKSAAELRQAAAEDAEARLSNYERAWPRLLEYLAWYDEPYDGVLGVLPSWAPNDTQARFVETRCRLLGDYPHAELLEFLESYASRVLSPSGWQGSHTLIRKEIRHDIAYLHHIKQAVALGKEDGLRLLAGERIALDAVTGGKVSDGGRKGHEIAHGTAEKKEGRWQDYQAAIDKLDKDFPQYSHNKLCQIAAVELKVGVSTLRLRTKKPLKRGQRC